MILRVAVMADLAEEGWPSMDLVAEMFVRELGKRNGERLTEVEGAGGIHEEGVTGSQEGATGEAEFRVEMIRPTMRRRFSAANQSQGRGFTFDRLLNRFYDYPRFLRSHRHGFDLFHLADHSYSQLVHELPPERTVVTCHDLDTFRCLWEPQNDCRGPVFRAMTRRILSGMQKAAHVCCDSQATRDELLDRRLLPPERVSVVPLGLRPEFLQPPDAAEDASIAAMLEGEPSDSIYLLHVGSTISRKRIDILLEVFARLSRKEPRLRLLRVGGAFSPAQAAHAERLGVEKRVRVLPFLSVAELASVYRRAALVLLPSDAEGFGFPVIEAMACGTPVLASDLAVLREVGGEATSYAPVAEIDGWVGAVQKLLAEREMQPVLWQARREAGLRQGRKFTWAETARKTCQVFRKTLVTGGPGRLNPPL